MPDGLLPFEVVILATFGAIFFVASSYHFRTTFQTLSVDRVRFLESIA